MKLKHIKTWLKKRRFIIIEAHLTSCALVITRVWMIIGLRKITPLWLKLWWIHKYRLITLRVSRVVSTKSSSRHLRKIWRTSWSKSTMTAKLWPSLLLSSDILMLRRRKRRMEDPTTSPKSFYHTKWSPRQYGKPSLPQITMLKSQIHREKRSQEWLSTQKFNSKWISESLPSDVKISSSRKNKVAKNIQRLLVFQMKNF